LDVGRLDVLGLVIGAVLLFVGVYYFLSNTLGFNLGDINGDAIWPIIVIGIGVAMLLRVWQRANLDDEVPPES
jgi:hypothetical protein